MANYIVAGVGVVTAFQKGTSPVQIFTSSTLQEQSMSLSISSEDIRGGMSNALLGNYFHDSLLECTLTDALFNMNYIALNAGGQIQTNNNSIVTESVTVGTGGTITVSTSPQEFGEAGTVGWYAVEGTDTWNWVTFTNSTATVSSLTAGTKVCVKYCQADTGMSYFTVPSQIIPSIVHLYMTYPLFSAGSSDEVSSKTQVGELIIDIPRFQFSGAFDMSLTASGAATSNLTGKALAKTTTSNCTDLSSYADVKLKLYDSVWYQDLTAIYVDGAEFSLASGATKTLSCYGVYKNGATGSIPNSLLTFSTDSQSTASVSSAGVVTGGTASVTPAHIEIIPTSIEGYARPTGVAGYAEVTVTASE